MATVNFENIRLNRKTLLFPPDIEKLFFLQGVVSKTAFLRIGTIVLLSVNLLLQYYNFKGFGLISTLLILPLSVVHFLLKNKRYTDHIDFFSCLCLFFSGTAIICMITHAPEDLLNFPILVFLIISGFIFFKLPYLAAGLTGLGLVLIYGVSLLYLTAVPVTVISHKTFFLFFVTVIGMTAGYTIEYFSKMVFLKSAILQQIIRETEKKNTRQGNELLKTNKSLMLEILAHTEAESRLKESEEKYRNLVRSLPEGIFIVQNRKIVFLNPSMEKLTGYDAKQLIGSGPDQLFIRNKAEEFKDKPLALEFIVNPDGQKVFIEKNFVEINYKSKPALLFSVRDITEKVAATQEKMRLQKELEKAKTMEAFGILASGVAHDLNNVLSGLVSIPELLLMDIPKDSKLIEHVSMIKDSGKMASVIVDELLTIVRGSVKICEPIQFNHVIEEYFLSPEYQSLSEAHPNVEIIKKLDTDLPVINASNIHMRKIVMNLVSNAVEAVGEKKGNVIVQTCPVEFHHQRISGYEIIENGKFVKFTIMDTGNGISKDDIDHIFEPFYSKKILGRSGTGLGLSIVWNAVHDHKGYIHVSSQNGQTYFTLYFPVSEKTIVPEVSPEIYTFSDYAGNNERILVVDDMASQQKIAANILKRLGYQVKAVSSGEAAIVYAKENKIDLVVLDMIMAPGLSGLETFKQLLLIDPAIKAIITSGYSKTADVEKAQALGAGEYIKKPYSLQKIGVSIKKELLNRKKKE